MRLNDPDVVRSEYASEAGLEGRRAVWARHPTTGPHAIDLAVAAVLDVAPRRLLEVGSGTGDLAARLQRESGADVVAVDLSPRMVELTRAQGVDAVEADVQELPFSAGEFDCAVAAWMLYHVPDVERGLAELARVLRPGGRLVAITNALDHMRELRELVGLDSELPTPFSAENGRELLERHFARVELQDAGGTIELPDRDAVVAYVEASVTLFAHAGAVPAFGGPLVATRHPVVFVADKA